MSINIKPINELAGKVSDLMYEPVASSLEEAQAWDENPNLKLSKYRGYNIQLPENEINKAIEVWEEIEKRFIGILKKNFNQTMHDFIQNYKNIREALINKKIDGNTIIEISKYRSITYEVVWNISWIDLFVWQLPKINLNNSSKYISIAERMLAIKYIETLNKNSSLLFDYAELFPFIRNLEARAKMIEKEQIEIEKIENDQIENALIDGIRRTINRFRERPLNYFTESDIHSSLMKDIMAGNSKIFLFQDDKFPEVSLIHNEYPTNFRYEKKKLLKGYTENDVEIEELTMIDVKTGDRGNFDLSILNRDFIENMFNNPVCLKNDKGKRKDLNNMNESIKNIINKNKDYSILRKSINQNKFQEELLYAIEVKFIHPFNARDKGMLDEVIKDNRKLKLARIHSGGKTKVLNLIFCSSEALERRDKDKSIIAQIKKYINQQNETQKIPNDVINIFIESYIFKDSKNESTVKETEKPIISIGGNYSDNMFFKKFKKALKIWD